MKKYNLVQTTIVVCILLFSLSMFCLSSCNPSSAKKIDLGDTSNIELVHNQKLIVALDSQEQNIDDISEDSLLSFNKDIAKLVSSDLSLNVEIFSMDLSDVVSSINEKSEEFDIAFVKFNPNLNNKLLCSTPYYRFNNNSNDKVDYVVVMSKEKKNLHEVINKDIAIRIYDDTIFSIASKWFQQDKLEG